MPGASPRAARRELHPLSHRVLGAGVHPVAPEDRVQFLDHRILAGDALDDPFALMEKILRENVLGKSCQALFVDFHGEATSEKYSFAHHFDGRVSAVIGTHTHAPTADTHILSGGTAYQSDAGMTGDYDSVIGVRKDIAIQRFLKKMPGEPLIPASENKTLCGVFIVTDDRSGKAVSVDPVRVGDTLPNTVPKV